MRALLPGSGGRQTHGWCSPCTRFPAAPDAAAAGRPDGERHSSRQVAAAARLVAAELGVAGHEVVWQSRFESRRVLWLGPNAPDHIVDMPTRTPVMIVTPPGVVSGTR